MDVNIGNIIKIAQKSFNDCIGVLKDTYAQKENLLKKEIIK